MSDRFYTQQNEYFKLPKGNTKLTDKKVRRLKKDAIAEVEKLLNVVPDGIEKMTIANIDSLFETLCDFQTNSIDFGEVAGFKTGYEEGAADMKYELENTE
ncbi:MAG: hypothetical protein DRN17_03530 [Thermoplasmata archaeon]|nr:MAG: hypothetical protein DRN17_03530 [Thermoplasmata archaeon]